MSAVDIDQLHIREEPTSQGQDLIRDVVAPGAADEQSRLVEVGRLRVVEGELAEADEGLAQGEDGELEAVRAVGGGDAGQVREEEVPHKGVGDVGGEDAVDVLAARVVPRVDRGHPLHVRPEVVVQRALDGGVVDGDEVGEEGGVREGEGHGYFGAPGVV